MNTACSVNRREFLKGIFAFAASLSGARVFAVGDDLKIVPAYYIPYLASRIADINRSRMEQGYSAGFFFVTDLHILSNRCHSGAMLCRLVRETGIRKVICGGDLPVAFGTGDDLDKIVNDLWPNLWREPLHAAGATLTAVKGNHDFHITDKSKGKGRFGLQYSAEETAKILRLCNGNAALVADETNPTCCYGYHDEVDEKIRYVFVDTSDAPCKHQDHCGVEGGHVQMSERQLKWLAGKAFGAVPAGYGVVVVQHVPVAPVVMSHNVGPTLQKFRSLMKAYQNKATFEIGGESFDFAKRVGGKVIVNLTGHHHSDRQSWFCEFLHISESCDAAYSDNIRRTPFSGQLPKKATGSVYEQTFDCVQINAKESLLKITRIGGGQDRVYHLEPIDVSVGASVKLAPKVLKGPVNWLSIDCDEAKVKDKATTPEEYWHFNHRHGAIASDGTFTAVSPGPALAIALTPDYLKEFYPINVAQGAGGN